MHCGRTMVSEMLSGRRFPSWEQDWALVQACVDSHGADSHGKELEERWHGWWLSASRKLDALRYGQAGSGQEPADLTAAADVASTSHDQDAFSLEETRTSLLPATWYRDHPQFYRAFAQYMRRARAEIRPMLAWIRRHRDETQDILNYEASVMPSIC